MIAGIHMAIATALSELEHVSQIDRAYVAVLNMVHPKGSQDSQRASRLWGENTSTAIRGLGRTLAG